MPDILIRTLPKLECGSIQAHTPNPYEATFLVLNASSIPDEPLLKIDAIVDGVVVQTVDASQVKLAGTFTFTDLDSSPHKYELYLYHSTDINYIPSKYTSPYYTLSKLSMALPESFATPIVQVGHAEIVFSYVSQPTPDFTVTLKRDGEVISTWENALSGSFVDLTIPVGIHTYELTVHDAESKFDPSRMAIATTAYTKLKTALTFVKKLGTSQNFGKLIYEYSIPEQPIAAFYVDIIRRDVTINETNTITELASNSMRSGVIVDPYAYVDEHAYEITIQVRDVVVNSYYTVSDPLSVVFTANVLSASIGTPVKNVDGPYTLTVPFNTPETLETDGVVFDVIVDNSIVETVSALSVKTDSKYVFKDLHSGNFEFSLTMRDENEVSIPLSIGCGVFYFEKLSMGTVSVFSTVSAIEGTVDINYTLNTQPASYFVDIYRNDILLSSTQDINTASLVDNSVPRGNHIYKIVVRDENDYFIPRVVTNEVIVRTKLLAPLTLTKELGVDANFKKYIFSYTLPAQEITPFEIVFVRRDVTDSSGVTRKIEVSNDTLSGTIIDEIPYINGHHYEFDLYVHDFRINSTYSDSDKITVSYDAVVLPDLVVEEVRNNDPGAYSVTVAFSNAASLPDGENFIVDAYLDTMLNASVPVATFKGLAAHVFANLGIGNHTFSFVVRDTLNSAIPSKITLLPFAIERLTLSAPAEISVTNLRAFDTLVVFTVPAQLSSNYDAILLRNGATIKTFPNGTNCVFSDTTVTAGTYTYEVQIVDRDNRFNSATKSITVSVRDSIKSLTSIVRHLGTGASYDKMVFDYVSPVQPANLFKISIVRTDISMTESVTFEKVLTNSALVGTIEDPNPFTDGHIYEYAITVKYTVPDSLYDDSATVTMGYTANVLPALTFDAPLVNDPTPYTLRVPLTNIGSYDNVSNFVVDAILDGVVVETVAIPDLVISPEYTFDGLFPSLPYEFSLMVRSVDGESIPNQVVIGSYEFAPIQMPAPTSFTVTGLYVGTTSVAFAYPTIHSGDYEVILRRDGLVLERFVNVASGSFNDIGVSVGLKTYTLELVDRETRFTSHTSTSQVTIRDTMKQATTFTRHLGTGSEWDQIKLSIVSPLQPIETYNLTIRIEDLTAGTSESYTIVRSNGALSYTIFDPRLLPIVAGHAYRHTITFSDTAAGSYYDVSPASIIAWTGVEVPLLEVGALSQNDPIPYTLVAPIVNAASLPDTVTVLFDYVVNGVVVSTVTSHDLLTLAKAVVDVHQAGTFNCEIRTRDTSLGMEPVRVVLEERIFSRLTLASPTTFDITGRMITGTTITYEYPNLYTSDFDVVIRRNGETLYSGHAALSGSYIDTMANPNVYEYELTVIDNEGRFNPRNVLITGIVVQQKLNTASAISIRSGTVRQVNGVTFYEDDPSYQVISPSQPVAVYAKIKKVRLETPEVEEFVIFDNVPFTSGALTQTFGKLTDTILDEQEYRYEVVLTAYDPSYVPNPSFPPLYIDADPLVYNYTGAVVAPLIMTLTEHTPTPYKVRAQIELLSGGVAKYPYDNTYFFELKSASNRLNNTIVASGTISDIVVNGGIFDFTVDSSGVKDFIFVIHGPVTGDIAALYQTQMTITKYPINAPIQFEATSALVDNVTISVNIGPQPVTPVTSKLFLNDAQVVSTFNSIFTYTRTDLNPNIYTFRLEISDALGKFTSYNGTIQVAVNAVLQLFASPDPSYLGSIDYAMTNGEPSDSVKRILSIDPTQTSAMYLDDTTIITANTEGVLHAFNMETLEKIKVLDADFATVIPLSGYIDSSNPADIVRLVAYSYKSGPLTSIYVKNIDDGAPMDLGTLLVASVDSPTHASVSFLSKNEIIYIPHETYNADVALRKDLSVSNPASPGVVLTTKTDFNFTIIPFTGDSLYMYYHHLGSVYRKLFTQIDIDNNLENGEVLLTGVPYAFFYGYRKDNIDFIVHRSSSTYLSVWSSSVNAVAYTVDVTTVPISSTLNGLASIRYNSVHNKIYVSTEEPVRKTLVFSTLWSFLKKYSGEYIFTNGSYLYLSRLSMNVGGIDRVLVPYADVAENFVDELVEHPFTPASTIKAGAELYALIDRDLIKSNVLYDYNVEKGERLFLTSDVDSVLESTDQNVYFSRTAWDTVQGYIRKYYRYDRATKTEHLFHTDLGTYWYAKSDHPVSTERVEVVEYGGRFYWIHRDPGTSTSTLYFKLLTAPDEQAPTMVALERNVYKFGRVNTTTAYAYMDSEDGTTIFTLPVAADVIDFNSGTPQVDIDGGYTVSSIFVSGNYFILVCNQSELGIKDLRGGREMFSALDAYSFGPSEGTSRFMYAEINGSSLVVSKTGQDSGELLTYVFDIYNMTLLLTSASNKATFDIDSSGQLTIMTPSGLVEQSVNSLGSVTTNSLTFDAFYDREFPIITVKPTSTGFIYTSHNINESGQTVHDSSIYRMTSLETYSKTLFYDNALGEKIIMIGYYEPTASILYGIDYRDTPSKAVEYYSKLVADIDTTNKGTLLFTSYDQLRVATIRDTMLYYSVSPSSSNRYLHRKVLSSGPGLGTMVSPFFVNAVRRLGTTTKFIYHDNNDKYLYLYNADTTTITQLTTVPIDFFGVISDTDYLYVLDGKQIYRKSVTDPVENTGTLLYSSPTVIYELFVGNTGYFYMSDGYSLNFRRYDFNNARASIVDADIDPDFVLCVNNDTVVALVATIAQPDTPAYTVEYKFDTAVDDLVSITMNDYQTDPYIGYIPVCAAKLEVLDDVNAVVYSDISEVLVSHVQPEM